MNRTLSSGSRVPPAVTSTRSPLQPAAPHSGSSSLIAAPCRTRQAPPRTPRGSGPGRPGADALLAVRGESTAVGLDDQCTALAQRRRFACVAACSYMRLFIAGAITSGHRRPARNCTAGCPPGRWRAWRSCSPRPARSRRTSARATSSRWLSGSCSGSGCPGKAPRAGSRSNSLTSTGAPVSASKDAAPTNRRLAGVCTTRTACPAPVARRTSSSALYAAMPPLTPSRIRDMAQVLDGRRRCSGERGCASACAVPRPTYSGT